MWRGGAALAEVAAGGGRAAAAQMWNVGAVGPWARASIGFRLSHAHRGLQAAEFRRPGPASNQPPRNWLQGPASRGGGSRPVGGRRGALSGGQDETRCAEWVGNRSRATAPAATRLGGGAAAATGIPICTPSPLLPIALQRPWAWPSSPLRPTAPFSAPCTSCAPCAACDGEPLPLPPPPAPRRRPHQAARMPAARQHPSSGAQPSTSLPLRQRQPQRRRRRHTPSGSGS